MRAAEAQPHDEEVKGAERERRLRITMLLVEYSLGLTLERLTNSQEMQRAEEDTLNGFYKRSTGVLREKLKSAPQDTQEEIILAHIRDYVFGNTATAGITERTPDARASLAAEVLKYFNMMCQACYDGASILSAVEIAKKLIGMQEFAVMNAGILARLYKHNTERLAKQEATSQS